jgi:DNA-binding GntR family transcriptional regulator
MSALGVARQTFPTHVASFISDAICSGRLAPGERIAEADLATELGISRTPVREALRILDAQGLVVGVGGVGFVVRQLSVRQIQALYEVRAPLEGQAAGLAAKFRSDEELWELERILDRAARATVGVRDQTAANLGFHTAIAALSRNEFLEDFIRKLSVRPLVYRALYWYSADERRESDDEHRSIFAAIAAGSTKQSVKAMRDHTLRIGSFMCKTLREHPEFTAPE